MKMRSHSIFNDNMAEDVNFYSLESGKIDVYLPKDNANIDT